VTLTHESGWARAIGAGLLVGALLTIEHLVCYRESDFEKEPELVLLGSNVLGTATIAVGVAVAAQSPDEVVRHITVAGIGGTVVIVLRIARRLLRHNNTMQSLAGHGIGLIDGVLGNDQTYHGPRARDFRG
jgi:hypothetical protein